MKRYICSTLSLLLFIASSINAQETPRWLSHSAISQDGKRVAFAYQGDIFIVSADGGQAFQVTSSPYYESDPFWSADGKQLVFSSMSENSRDVWAVPASGGSPKQLTTFTGAETPLAVLQDGTVIYNANILPDTQAAVYPSVSQLYKVPIEGGKSELVATINTPNMAVSVSGAVLFEDYKGYEDDLRKHHTSSVTRDIWYYNDGKPGFTMDTEGTFTHLTTFAGEDRNPVFAPGGRWEL